MEIKKYHQNIFFNAKLETAKVLETTSLKIFRSDGISGIKEVVLSLTDTPFKATGAKGYKGYAYEIGNKIIDKYPQIADATNKIKKILQEYPHIKKDELNEKISPIITEIGEIIDITI